jgi:ubiquinone/menaquinone biosynthesis C-methylase UbiE
LAGSYLQRGDHLGWFEALYSEANADPEVIPWADLEVNPNLTQWLDMHQPEGLGKKALVIGGGLGDDAEELAKRQFRVTAFDISSTAIAWCRNRFPKTDVTYAVADLFAPPETWNSRFDLVLESYTLQVLPPAYRPLAMRACCKFVAPGGILLVISRGRDASADPGSMPWPLTRKEFRTFEEGGLREVSFEDYVDSEVPPVRRFRAAYESPR